MQASLYQQAAHCYEELLLHTPSCIAYYVQYADVMYTLGGTHASGHRAEAVASDYRTAQSYYAAAVHMSKGNNLRALYGLCAATSQVAGLKVNLTCHAHVVLMPVHTFCLRDCLDEARSLCKKFAEDATRVLQHTCGMLHYLLCLCY